MNGSSMGGQRWHRTPSRKRTQCDCGSGFFRRPLTDARGIFCCFVCDSCWREKQSRFRPEIFTDPNYKTIEPIEPE